MRVSCKVILFSIVALAVGCTRSFTIPAEEAFNSKKAKSESLGEGRIVSLETVEGKKIFFSEGGATYVAAARGFVGSTVDSVDVSIPETDVTRITVHRSTNCVDALSSYIAKKKSKRSHWLISQRVDLRASETPLSIDKSMVQKITLVDGSVISISKLGLRFDCTDSVWVDMRNSKWRFRSKEITSLEYRKSGPETYLVAGVVAAIVVGVVVLAASDPLGGRGFY